MTTDNDFKITIHSFFRSDYEEINEPKPPLGCYEMVEFEIETKNGKDKLYEYVEITKDSITLYSRDRLSRLDDYIKYLRKLFQNDVDIYKIREALQNSLNEKIKQDPGLMRKLGCY